MWLFRLTVIKMQKMKIKDHGGCVSLLSAELNVHKNTNAMYFESMFMYIGIILKGQDFEN